MKTKLIETICFFFLFAFALCALLAYFDVLTK